MPRKDPNEISDNFARLSAQVKEAIKPMDSQTKSILKESEFISSQVINHGYFPKEIIGYLASRLREVGVPCEVGFDRELADSKDGVAASLRSKYRDSRPFYFLAFPMEYRKLAKKTLLDTSYPLPDDPESDAEAEKALKKKKKEKAEKDMKRMMMYIIFMILAGFAVVAFIFLSNIILE